MHYFFEGNTSKENLELLVIIMFIVLLLEVIAQFYFVYMASWLGQDIVKDIREKLFTHLSHFKMKYFILFTELLQDKKNTDILYPALILSVCYTVFLIKQEVSMQL